MALSELLSSLDRLLISGVIVYRVILLVIPIGLVGLMDGAVNVSDFIGFISYKKKICIVHQNIFTWE